MSKTKTIYIVKTGGSRIRRPDLVRLFTGPVQEANLYFSAVHDLLKGIQTIATLQTQQELLRKKGK